LNFQVITVMPELVQATLNFGVVGRAFEKGICQLDLINPRTFTNDNHQTIDDRPFGGGDGMLMLPEPLQASLDSLVHEGPIVYLSPQGQLFNDSLARQWSVEKSLTLLCGRYGGVDHRFLLKNKIQEVSIGDYVLSGGELAAAVVIDAVTRMIPGVLGHTDSADEDSFAKGLLEAPHFTRPREWQGMGVPPLLLCGDHKRVQEFKDWGSLVFTLIKRPELLKNKDWNRAGALAYFGKLAEENLTFLGLERTKVLKLLDEKTL